MGDSFGTWDDVVKAGLVLLKHNPITLLLIRGLPGSGKSTLARRLVELCPGTGHFEADQYHMVGHKYDFKQENQHAAHQSCQERCRTHLLNAQLSSNPAEWHSAIVSNTSTTEKEIRVYEEIARDYNVLFLVISLNTSMTPEESAARTVHAVPLDVLKRMKDRWQHWNMEYILGYKYEPNA